MSQAAFPAGQMIAEGTLFADPKKINSEGKTATIALKVKLNYRERENDDIDAFFVDIIVSGSMAENILAADWKKYDRISFVGDFKGHRWERKLEDGGFNEEQTITIFARQIGATPRFTEVTIASQDYEGGNDAKSDSRSSSRRSSSRNDAEEAPAARRSSRRNNDDDEAPAERSSRRSSRNSDDVEEEAPTARRSSRRARDTQYGADD